MSAPHYVSLTVAGQEALSIASIALPRRLLAMLVIVSNEPKEIHALCRATRKLRDVPFSNEQLVSDLADLAGAGLVKIYQ